MERGKHRRSLLEYAHKDVHRHTLTHLILQAFSMSETASKRLLVQWGFDHQSKNTIHNQQRYKAIIATKEFQSSPDAKMVSQTLNSFLSNTHFSRSVFPQKMLRKRKKMGQISLVYTWITAACPDDRRVENKTGLTTGCHSRLKPYYINCVSGKKKFWVFLSLCLRYSMAEPSEGWLKAETAALPANSWIIILRSFWTLPQFPNLQIISEMKPLFFYP